MITKEQILATRQIVTHGLCPDGLASAIICYQTLIVNGVTPEVKFILYNSKDHKELEPTDGQLFVDISPPNAEKWKDTKFLLLDHHDTVKSLISDLGGVYGGTEQSGALLAYHHIMEPLFDDHNKVFQHFAECISIRDTWKKDHELWMKANHFSSGIMFYGWQYFMDRINNHEGLDFKEILKVGAIDFESKLTSARHVAEKAVIVEQVYLDQIIKVGYYNKVGAMVSDASNMLIENGCDMAISYGLTTDEEHQPMMKFSARSNAKIPAHKLAEIFGGGGHPRAAGFVMKKAGSISLDTAKSLIQSGLINLKLKA